MFRFIASPMTVFLFLGGCGGSVGSGSIGGASGAGAETGAGGASGGAPGGSGGSPNASGSGGLILAGGATQGGTGPTSRVPMNHRATAAPCPVSTTPRPAPGPVPPCTSDAECASAVGGRCSGGQCIYDCTSDQECAPGVCLCSDPPGGLSYCTTATCHVDADCPGSYCSPTFGTCGNYSGVIDYQCHTPDDECTDDSDCTGTGSLMAYCMYDPLVSHWICSNSHCVG